MGWEGGGLESCARDIFEEGPILRGYNLKMMTREDTNIKMYAKTINKPRNSFNGTIPEKERNIPDKSRSEGGQVLSCP